MQLFNVWNSEVNSEVSEVSETHPVSVTCPSVFQRRSRVSWDTLLLGSRDILAPSKCLGTLGTGGIELEILKRLKK